MPITISIDCHQFILPWTRSYIPRVAILNVIKILRTKAKIFARNQRGVLEKIKKEFVSNNWNTFYFTNINHSLLPGHTSCTFSSSLCHKWHCNWTMGTTAYRKGSCCKSHLWLKLLHNILPEFPNKYITFWIPVKKLPIKLSLTWGVGFVQDLRWSINPPPHVTTTGTPEASALIQGVLTVDLNN